MDSQETSETEILARASRAFIEESKTFLTSTPFNNRQSTELFPDYPLSKAIELVRNDSVAWGGVTTIVDRALETGWRIVDTETGERKPELERLLKGKSFNFWLREILTNFLIFNNAFGELVFAPGGTVKELHNLSPAEIRILTTEHGEVIEYLQERHSGNSKKTVARWKPDEILHVADVNIGLNTWGEVSVRSIWVAAAIKHHIKKFILWLFETNQFRSIHKIKAVDEDQVRQFFVYLKESETHLNKPLVVDGEYEHMLMRDWKDINVLNEVVYKMDEEILNLLQVPPIYAGLPDNSNRSNSDAQERAFNTRIKSIHTLLEMYLNELLRRMKLFKVEFRFNPLAVKNEKEVLEAAQLMKDVGLKKEIIGDYLRERGLPLPPGDLFEPLPEPLMGGPAQPGGKPENMFPSRRRKGVDQANQKIGTGDRGTTREEQLTGRSSSFGSYPYVWNLEVDE